MERNERTGRLKHGGPAVEGVLQGKAKTMGLEASYVCAYCLQINEITVDPSAGAEQEYIEDCQVCCRPNKLRIVIDEELEEVDVSAEVP